MINTSEHKRVAIGAPLQRVEDGTIRTGRCYVDDLCMQNPRTPTSCVPSMLTRELSRSRRKPRFTLPE